MTGGINGADYPYTRHSGYKFHRAGRFRTSRLRGRIGRIAPAAPPILVVGNTGDPATPYAWAPALTKELGGRATLLTLKGEGHGAYDTGDTCVRRAVDGYLLDGKIPPNGTTCQ